MEITQQRSLLMKCLPKACIGSSCSKTGTSSGLHKPRRVTRCVTSTILLHTRTAQLSWTFRRGTVGQGRIRMLSMGRCACVTRLLAYHWYVPVKTRVRRFATPKHQSRPRIVCTASAKTASMTRPKLASSCALKTASTAREPVERGAGRQEPPTLNVSSARRVWTVRATRQQRR